MSQSLYLFQNSQTVNDLIGHISRLAQSKAQTFYISFGVTQDADHRLKYSSTIVLTDNHGKKAHQIIDGELTPVALFSEIEKFLEGLK